MHVSMHQRDIESVLNQQFGAMCYLVLLYNSENHTSTHMYNLGSTFRYVI